MAVLCAFYVTDGLGIEDCGARCRKTASTASSLLLVQTNSSLSSTGSGPYVPGTPGAKWSEQEARVVKGELFKLFSVKRQPLAPLTVRLGFHDCVLYQDGSGGCDGCLDWTGMDEAHGFNGCPSNVGTNEKGGNRRLDVIVEKLEVLYHEDLSTTIGSLHKTGKSRADLWAFAAMAAVEYGIYTNAEICDDPESFLEHDRVKPQCHSRVGEDDCMVELPRSFVFQAGRADCVTDMKLPYQTLKPEKAPNVQGNAEDTVQYFKQVFKFTGRETVAILGAHTFGRFHGDEGSCLQYVWTSRAENLWNTQYYRNLAGKHDWYFNDDMCNPIGDFSGAKTKATTWVMRSPIRPTISGTQWFLKMKVCLEDCHQAGEETFETMVDGRDSGGISPDLGLVFDFTVDSEGVPHGCPGMNEHYEAGKCCMFEAKCPKTQLAEPAGSTPLHKIVEEYAESPASWMRDFVPAYEKMLSNGYLDGNLHKGLSLDIKCDPGPHDGSYTQGRKWVCWKPVGLGKPFKLIHADTGKALTVGKSTGVLLLSNWKGQDHQKWQWTADGKQIISVFSGVPMGFQGKDIGASGHWRFSGGRLYAEELPPLGICFRNNALGLLRAGHSSCAWLLKYI